MKMIRKISEADLVITVSYRNGIRIIKNRDGISDQDKEIDLSRVLELLLPFQKEYLYPLLSNWISKLKTYRIFS